MRTGSIGELRQKASELKQRLAHFVVNDIRRDPILGLYLVLGVMIVVFAAYFGSIIYRDIKSGETSRAAKPEKGPVQQSPAGVKQRPGNDEATAATAVDQVAKAEGSSEQEKAVAPEEDAEHEAARRANKANHQGTVAEASAAAKEQRDEAALAAGRKCDKSTWQSLEFPDSSRIFFPADWTHREMSAQKKVLYGIRVEVPGSDASIRCYSRERQPRDSFAASLKEMMSKDGNVNIKEETKKINSLDATELSGVLKNKHMVISIFNHKPEKYFIVSLVAGEEEYVRLRPYYNTMVESFETGENPSPADVSIENIEEKLEESIEEDKEVLIGTVVKIRLKNGTKHKGLIVAEDDTTYILEGFRFGGRYGFTIEKEEIEEISY